MSVLTKMMVPSQKKTNDWPMELVKTGWNWVPWLTNWDQRVDR